MKKLIITLFIIFAGLFFCLSFHILTYPHFYIFPKSHLTLENTFIAKADIEKMGALYQSASEYDKLLIKQDPLFKKLKIIFSTKNKITNSKKIDLDKFKDLLKTEKIKHIQVLNKHLIFIYFNDVNTSDPQYYFIIENPTSFINEFNEINNKLQPELRVYPEYIEEEE